MNRCRAIAALFVSLLIGAGCEFDAERIDRAKSDLKMLEEYCDRHFLETGRDPSDLSVLVRYAPTKEVTERESITRSVTTRESTLPLVDPWGTRYAIQSDRGGPLRRTLRSAGPDRKELTPDDIVRGAL